MPRFGPVSRRELVAALKKAGFEGPFSGGKYQFMVRQKVSIRIPNPHQWDIGIELLSRVLKQAHVTRDEWEDL